jgi:catalase
MDQKQLTTAAGRPVGDNQNALTVGPRGPIIFELDDQRTSDSP